jgi:hypothetical protein
MHEEPVSPRRLNDRVPRDLETICLKAMSKEPSQRYATAADLADDLQRWLDGEPVLARNVGTLGRAWRWCRRNPKVAALNLVVVAVLLAGAVDVARYALPQEHWGREAAAARHEAERWRNEAEQRRSELERLAQAMVFNSQDADSRGELKAVLRGLDSIRSDSRDDSVRQTIAVAHSRLGDLLSRDQELVEADKHYRAAIQLLTELVRTQPSRREWPLEIAQLLMRSAELARRLGHESDVESRVAESVFYLDSVERDARDSVEICELAQTRGRVADSLFRLGQSDAARRQLRSSCESLGRIASRPNSSVQQLRDALAAAGRLANDLLEHQEFAMAETVLEPATAWAERLLATPGITFADQQTAVLLFRNVTIVERQLDRRADAEQRWEQLSQVLLRMEADERTTTQIGWQEWITAQRRELMELRRAIRASNAE